MRIATRLIVTLSITTTAVMVLYALIALDQREGLLREGLARETETLARSVQIVVNNALRDGRFEDLNRILRRVAEDPQTLVAVVTTGDGDVLAGGPRSALACLEALPDFREAGAAPPGAPAEGEEGAQGWVDCAGEARWMALPVRDPGELVLLGRYATVLERDRAGSRWRILFTTLALAAAASTVILLVLRSALSVPLSQIMHGVRSLGGPNPPTRVEVPRSAGELRDLAGAFNEMAERLEGKRQALIQEVEERVALERRLRSAEKFAALGRLAGGLAHELGSPLNVIAVRAEMIDARPDRPEDVRRQAGEIVAQVERIAELVRSLRHVTRGHPIEPRPVDLARVVHSAANDVREAAASAGIALRVEADGSLVVQGDETLLRHAVANLALNSVQALEGQSAERRLTIRVERDEAVARVVVEDTGPGIPEDMRDRIFEPFFTTREVGEGMGLGLAISQGIAHEHGGELWLERREGGGLRAVLTLPLESEGGGRA